MILIVQLAFKTMSTSDIHGYFSPYWFCSRPCNGGLGMCKICSLPFQGTHSLVNVYVYSTN